MNPISPSETIYQYYESLKEKLLFRANADSDSTAKGAAATLRAKQEAEQTATDEELEKDQEYQPQATEITIEWMVEERQNLWSSLQSKLLVLHHLQRENTMHRYAKARTEQDQTSVIFDRNDEKQRLQEVTSTLGKAQEELHMRVHELNERSLALADHVLRPPVSPMYVDLLQRLKGIAQQEIVTQQPTLGLGALQETEFDQIRNLASLIKKKRLQQDGSEQQLERDTRMRAERMQNVMELLQTRVARVQLRKSSVENIVLIRRFQLNFEKSFRNCLAMLVVLDEPLAQPAGRKGNKTGDSTTLSLTSEEKLVFKQHIDSIMSFSFLDTRLLSLRSFVFFYPELDAPDRVAFVPTSDLFDIVQQDPSLLDDSLFRVAMDAKALPQIWPNLPSQATLASDDFAPENKHISNLMLLLVSIDQYLRERLESKASNAQQPQEITAEGVLQNESVRRALASNRTEHLLQILQRIVAWKKKIAPTQIDTAKMLLDYQGFVASEVLEDVLRKASMQRAQHADAVARAQADVFFSTAAQLSDVKHDRAIVEQRKNPYIACLLDADHTAVAEIEAGMLESKKFAELVRAISTLPNSIYHPIIEQLEMLGTLDELLDATLYSQASGAVREALLRSFRNVAHEFRKEVTILAWDRFSACLQHIGTVIIEFIESSYSRDSSSSLINGRLFLLILQRLVQAREMLLSANRAREENTPLGLFLSHGVYLRSAVFSVESLLETIRTQVLRVLNVLCG